MSTPTPLSSAPPPLTGFKRVAFLVGRFITDVASLGTAVYQRRKVAKEELAQAQRDAKEQALQQSLQQAEDARVAQEKLLNDPQIARAVTTKQLLEMFDDGRGADALAEARRLETESPERLPFAGPADAIGPHGHGQYDETKPAGWTAPDTAAGEVPADTYARLSWEAWKDKDGARVEELRKLWEAAASPEELRAANRASYDEIRCYGLLVQEGLDPANGVSADVRAAVGIESRTKIKRDKSFRVDIQVGAGTHKLTNIFVKRGAGHESDRKRFDRLSGLVSAVADDLVLAGVAEEVATSSGVRTIKPVAGDKFNLDPSNPAHAMAIKSMTLLGLASGRSVSQWTDAKGVVQTPSRRGSYEEPPAVIKKSPRDHAQEARDKVARDVVERRNEPLISRRASELAAIAASEGVPLKDPRSSAVKSLRKDAAADIKYSQILDSVFEPETLEAMSREADFMGPKLQLGQQIDGFVPGSPLVVAAAEGATPKLGRDDFDLAAGP